MTSKKNKNIKSKPAESPEAREKQLTNLAMDLAEKQLMDGTAPPSVVQHFLKIGSSRESQEREMLNNQMELIEAKRNKMTKEDDSKKLLDQAIKAMSDYKGG